MRTAPFLAVASLVAACGGITVPVAQGTASPDTGGSQDTAASPGKETRARGDAAPPADGAKWQMSAHPCVGDRTDTLWFDDPETAWVGCGTTTEGYGLYRSKDAGKTWAAPATAPEDVLSTFRVSSVSRSADGFLYVGGADGTPIPPVQRCKVFSDGSHALAGGAGFFGFWRP